MFKISDEHGNIKQCDENTRGGEYYAEISVPLPYFGELKVYNELIGKEEVGGIFHSHENAVFVYGSCENGIEIQRKVRQHAKEANRGEIMSRTQDLSVGIIDMQAENYQKGMVKEILVGVQACEYTGNGNLIENRGQYQRDKGAYGAGGIHKGVQYILYLAILCKAAIENKDYLY